jgi:hypothetical protein
VRNLKNSGKLVPYPDLVRAFNVGAGSGWSQKSRKVFNQQYNRFINANGSLKAFEAPTGFEKAMRNSAPPVTWRNDRDSSIEGKGIVYVKRNPSGIGQQYFIQKVGSENRYYPVTNAINNYGRPIYKVSRLTYGTKGAPSGRMSISTR